MATSIHIRLALVYSVVLTFVLLIFGVVLYIAVERYLASDIDSSVAELAQHVAATTEVGNADVIGIALPDLDPFGAPGTHVQLLNASGQAIAHSAGLGIKELPVNSAGIAHALAGQPTYYTAAAGSERIRVYNLPLEKGGLTVGVVQVGKSHRDYDLTLAQLGQLMVGGGALAVVLAALAGWAVAGRALRPVDDITATARAIALSQGFSRRLPQRNAADEVGRLALAFNEMLESLEAAYTAQRRFVADASHELRAPLTTVRGNLEFVARSPDLPGEVKKEALADALCEADRMARLVHDLLALARSDAGQQVAMQPVALHLLVLDLWQDLSRRAKGEGLQLMLGTLDDAVVRGNPDRLKQLALILADNALKYTPAGKRVEISVRRERGQAALRVADNGIGIEPEDLPHIFDRFYRADKVRERDSGGAGLGLAIATSIVESHGGTIAVRSTPGEGSVFTVRLPRCG